MHVNAQPTWVDNPDPAAIACGQSCRRRVRRRWQRTPALDGSRGSGVPIPKSPTLRRKSGHHRTVMECCDYRIRQAAWHQGGRELRGVPALVRLPPKKSLESLTTSERVDDMRDDPLHCDLRDVVIRRQVQGSLRE